MPRVAKKPAEPVKKPAEPAKGEDRRRRIVEAATSLFSRYGYRRTSMDLLAAEAGVAKPTVYAYFADKDEVFRAVVAHVCDDILTRADAASRGEGSLEERLAAVLDEKFTYLFELVHRSPHAGELLAENDALAGDEVERTDRAFHRLLTRMLDEAVAQGEIDPRRVGLGSGAAASLLMRCGHGAAFDAQTTASHARHLAEMVRVVIAGLRASP